MVIRTHLILTGLAALAFGTLGCTPMPIVQPEASPTVRASKWAEEYDGSISRNSNELGKSSGSITDDKIADSAPKTAQTEPADPLPTQKYFPLKYEDRIPMPTPQGTAKKIDPGVEQSAFSSKDEEPEPQKSVLPSPKLIGVTEVNAAPKPGAQSPEVIPLPPFIRQEPTVRGGIIGLGPNESPLDRALELARRLVAAEAENKMMFVRMKRLEGELEAREKLLSDSLNEVEQATAEVSKVRGDLQSLRKDAAMLKKRLRDVEIEDLDTLRSIIAALEKLLAPEPRKLKEFKE